MWIKIPCIEYILRGKLTTKSMFDSVIMPIRLTVKDVPIDNYGLLNIRACYSVCFETLLAHNL